jgi:hypothetical protein
MDAPKEPPLSSENTLLAVPVQPLATTGDAEKSLERRTADQTATTGEAAEGGDDSDTDRNTYPEGGLRAWSVVFGAWCGLVACFGLMNSIGAFQAYISEEQLKDYSDGDIGWIFSVYVFLAFFCGVLFGPIFDTHGPRWLILAGSVLLVAAVMLISFSTSKAQATPRTRSRSC